MDYMPKGGIGLGCGQTYDMKTSRNVSLSICAALASAAAFFAFCGSVSAAGRHAAVRHRDVPPAQAPAFKVVIDTSAAPEMAEWSEKTLRPAVEHWYAEFCRRFPTKGWKPPKKITIRYKEGMKVPAFAIKPGNVITLNRRRFNKTKSVGCVMHELFHIVQQYRKTPKWITEAMADYARNYVWTTKGCPMNTRNRRARSKYAVGANFIAFVERRHPGTAVKLNDVCRRGKYKEDAFWPGATGKTLDELEKEWQASSPPPKKKRVVVKRRGK